MITRVRPGEATALHHLVNSAYRGESSKQGWTTEADLFDGPRITLDEVKKILGDPFYVVLKYAEHDSLLGCVALHKEDGKLYLGMFAVQPKMQSAGIGKKLLRAAEEEAAKQNCNTIFMTVISRRTELMAWYIRHGYADTGKRMDFDKADSRNNTAKVKLELAVLEKELKLL